MAKNEIRIEVKQESATSNKQASIKIFNGKKLISHIIAKIEYGRGADGRFYPMVTLVCEKCK